MSAFEHGVLCTALACGGLFAFWSFIGYLTRGFDYPINETRDNGHVAPGQAAEVPSPPRPSAFLEEP